MTTDATASAPDPQAGPLPEDAVAAYERDGVVVLRGVLPPSCIATLERGLAAAVAHPSLAARLTSSPRAGFQMEYCLWLRNPAVREVALRSPLARLAAQLMGSRRVRLFDTQLFAKRAGTSHETVMHEDALHLPLAGEQVCCMWVAAEPARCGEGVLEFVAGSHRRAPQDEPSPDRDAPRLAFDVDPGDVLAFHPRTLHGTTSPPPAGRDRTALAFRWAGDDVVYSPQSHTFPIVHRHDVRPGEALHGPLFPQVFPARTPEQAAEEDAKTPRLSLEAHYRLLRRGLSPGYRKRWKLSATR